MKTSVVETKPLTLKFIYNTQLFDTAEIVNDSAEVNFYYDSLNHSYTGNFKNSKISWNQILTYSLSCPEIHFVNTYYRLLKQSLDRKNPIRRHTALLYLERVRNGMADSYY